MKSLHPIVTKQNVQQISSDRDLSLLAVHVFPVSWHYCFPSLQESGSFPCQVSHEWLDTLRENNRNNAPRPKTNNSFKQAKEFVIAE